MNGLRTFGWSLAVTLAGLAAAGLVWGAAGLAAVGVLSVPEVSLSFDNAVVNATVLRRMNPFRQKMFLTLGILIAVFGMRLVFPLLVVSATTGSSPGAVLDLAINQPGQYAEHLRHAHPAIAAFGGVFLLMIALDFFLEEREVRWLGFIERPLAAAGHLERLSVLLALTLLATAQTLAPDRAATVLLAGILGLASYLAVNGLSQVAAYRGDLGLDSGLPQNVYQLDTGRMTQLKEADGTPFARALRPGNRMQLPDDAGSLTFDGLRQWASFRIARNPSNTTALWSSIAAGAGLTASLFIRRRRVWVRVRAASDSGSDIELAGLERAGSDRLADEVAALTAEVRSVLPLALSVNVEAGCR